MTKKESLERFNKMIAWAEKQDQEELCDCRKMKRHIGEHWRMIDCAYCDEVYFKNKSCAKCPLLSLGGCCDGLWEKMDDSKTWGEWVKWAKEVREYISLNG